MTKQKLIYAALRRFATQGYSETSMSQLAGDAGIKKATIYNYFKSKDDLYLTLLELCIAEELAITRTKLANDSVVINQAYLYNFLSDLAEEYNKGSNVKFLVKAFSNPPPELAPKLLRIANMFFNEIDKICVRAFRIYQVHHRKENSLDAETLGSAYVGLIYCIGSELNFKDAENIYPRLNALWTIFLTSL